MTTHTATITHKTKCFKREDVAIIKKKNPPAESAVSVHGSLRQKHVIFGFNIQCSRVAGLCRQCFLDKASHVRPWHVVAKKNAQAAQRWQEEEKHLFFCWSCLGELDQQSGKLHFFSSPQYCAALANTTWLLFYIQCGFNAISFRFIDTVDWSLLQVLLLLFFYFSNQYPLEYNFRASLWGTRAWVLANSPKCAPDDRLTPVRSDLISFMFWV